MEKIIRFSQEDLSTVFYQLLVSASDLVPVRAACLPHCGYLAMSLHINMILTGIAVANCLVMLEDKKEKFSFISA